MVDSIRASPADDPETLAGGAVVLGGIALLFVNVVKGLVGGPVGRRVVPAVVLNGTWADDV